MNSSVDSAEDTLVSDQASNKMTPNKNPQKKIGQTDTVQKRATPLLKYFLFFFIFGA